MANSSKFANPPPPCGCVALDANGSLDVSAAGAIPQGSAFAFGCGLLVFGGAGLGGGPDFLGGNSGVDSLKFDLELNGSLKSCR